MSELTVAKNLMPTGKRHDVISVFPVRKTATENVDRILRRISEANCVRLTFIDGKFFWKTPISTHIHGKFFSIEH